MTKIELIIGKKNKKGIFKKTKWYPNSIVISAREHQEYTELKELKGQIEAVRGGDYIRHLLGMHTSNDLQNRDMREI